MRRKYGKEYLVGVAVVDKFARNVAAVAIDGEEALLPTRFCCSIALKQLLKLC